MNDSTFILSVKINCEDSVSDGIDTQEAIMTARLLEVAAVDLIEISGRTYEQDLQFVKQRVSPFFRPRRNVSLHALAADSFFCCTGSILY